MHPRVDARRIVGMDHSEGRFCGVQHSLVHLTRLHGDMQLAKTHLDAYGAGTEFGAVRRGLTDMLTMHVMMLGPSSGVTLQWVLEAAGHCWSGELLVSRPDIEG